jgi:hypothetical protein
MQDLIDGSADDGHATVSEGLIIVAMIILLGLILLYGFANPDLATT